jgi:hypothetical protein
MTREQPKNTTYDAASFTVATAQTNRDIKANVTDLWKSFTDARFMRISTDQTITIRLNSTANAGIVMTSSESPREFTRSDEGLIITNLYVTNASGSTANMKVELYQ